jgi:hypothetical protein
VKYTFHILVFYTYGAQNINFSLPIPNEQHKHNSGSYMRSAVSLKSPPACSVQMAPKEGKEKNLKSSSFSVFFVTKKKFSMELS